eukprot:76297-Chlamydomonas_euryale.AAC.13
MQAACLQQRCRQGAHLAHAPALQAPRRASTASTLATNGAPAHPQYCRQQRRPFGERLPVQVPASTRRTATATPNRQGWLPAG